MDKIHFLMLFFGLGVIYLVIGLYAGRNIKDQAEYYLAGRNLSIITVALTLLATQLGGGMILGTAHEAYLVGIYGIAYSAGIFLGLSALAMGFASKLRGFNVSTTAELFETHYGSPLLRKFASVMMILSMSGILAGQIIASRMFMHGMGFESDILLLVFWALVIAYTVMGGLRAVVVTDVYQAIFILCVFGALFFYFLNDYPINTLDWRPALSHEGELIEWKKILPFLILPFMFCLIEQDMAQRIFAAKTKATATIAAVVAAVLVLLFAIIPAYFGLIAKYLQIEIPEGASVFVAVMQQLTHPAVMALVACGLFAAIVSTADSLLCAISSNISQDFRLGEGQAKRGLDLARGVTLLCAIFAIGIAFQMDNILEVLVQSYELPVACLFVSIFFCCILNKFYTMAAMFSVFFGLGAFIAFKLVPSVPYKEFLQVGISFVGYGVGMVWGMDNRNANKIKGNE